LTGSHKRHEFRRRSAGQSQSLRQFIAYRPRLIVFALGCLPWVGWTRAAAPPQSDTALIAIPISDRKGANSLAQVPKKTEPEHTNSLLSPPDHSQMTPMADKRTPLPILLEEARRNNPQILAARHAWKAASLVSSQASTLPDPQFTVQQFSVGSPRPFAGFSNSDFAYVGIGVSQDLPYPGKLRLKGEIANREAASVREEAEAMQRSVVQQLKATYFELAYVQQTLAILERSQKLLRQIEEVAEARYRVGQGSQEEVLKAQLQQTKLLTETAMHHQHMGTVEARLKQLLNRPPDSPDVTATELSETPLTYNSDELLARARTDNADVATDQEMVNRQSLQVESAHKDFYPDFNVQYMWQHTAEQFRDYYVLTFGVRIPIYRSRKQRPELAQAVEELNRSRREYENRLHQAYFDTRDQFLQARAAEQILKIYREGLIPQANATYQAALAAYQSNREDFETLLASFLDVLQLEEEYWQKVSEHETALARLEQLTGARLQ
jgi:outer membrane protein TolC